MLPSTVTSKAPLPPFCSRPEPATSAFTFSAVTPSSAKSSSTIVPSSILTEVTEASERSSSRIVPSNSFAVSTPLSLIRTPTTLSVSSVILSTFTPKSIATRAASPATPVIELSVEVTSSPRLPAKAAASCHCGFPAPSVPKTRFASPVPSVPILAVSTASSAILALVTDARANVGKSAVPSKSPAKASIPFRLVVASAITRLSINPSTYCLLVASLGFLGSFTLVITLPSMFSSPPIVSPLRFT